MLTSSYFGVLQGNLVSMAAYATGAGTCRRALLCRCASSWKLPVTSCFHLRVTFPLYMHALVQHPDAIVLQSCHQGLHTSE